MKSTQNTFYRECVIDRSSVNFMRTTKFYSFLVILIASAVVVNLVALSYLTTNIIIKNGGKIQIGETPLLYNSEIRGIFLNSRNLFDGPDWDAITDVMLQYDLNLIVGEFLTIQSAYYDSHYVKHAGATGRDELALALEAAHSKGIKVYVLDCTVYALDSRTQDVEALGAVRWNSDTEQFEQTTAACPRKAKQHILNLIEELITTHPDIDGFIFDFIRYESPYVCYCDECKAAFQEYLNETITDWSPFVQGGSRYEEWLEWRIGAINDIVKEGSQILRQHKPSIEIGVAAWTLWEGQPLYWRKFKGQDTAYWIKEGWIDFVSPMIYECSVEHGGDLEEALNAIKTQLLGDFAYWSGPEGKVPIIPFLRWEWYVEKGFNITAEEFATQINLVRELGADGWIVFRYGGPGNCPFDAGYAPDIREFLQLIDMPATFSIRKIQVNTSQTSATITWVTDLPTTSKVEYSIYPLFNATWNYRESVNFHYWDIDYVGGLIIENNATTTEHSITLNDLIPGTKYYFRVQSKNEYGTVTSKVLTFTTKTST